METTPLKTFEGQLIGEGLSFVLVIARFNEFITRKLMDGAMDALVRHGVDENKIDKVWVPGSYEIPLVAKRLAKSGHTLVIH